VAAIVIATVQGIYVLRQRRRLAERLSRATHRERIAVLLSLSGSGARPALEIAAPFLRDLRRHTAVTPASPSDAGASEVTSAEGLGPAG
jgi:hypothetical protein